MKNMYIRIPDELHARVKQRASQDGTSMNHIAVSALKSYLDSIKLQAVFNNDEYDQIDIFVSGNEVEKLEDFIKHWRQEQKDLWQLTRQQRDG